MTPYLEQDILKSTRIKKRISDEQYATGLFSLITEYTLVKRSFWWPLVRDKYPTNYSKRIASAIVGKIRGDRFRDWYFDKEISEKIMLKVKNDVKRCGWRIMEKSAK